MHERANTARTTSLNWPFRAALIALATSVVLLAPRVLAFPVLALPLSPFAIGVVGWAVGYFLVVVLLAAYRFRDRVLRGRPDYVSSRWSNSRMVAVSVVGAVLGCLHALTVADGVASW